MLVNQRRKIRLIRLFELNEVLCCCTTLTFVSVIHVGVCELTSIADKDCIFVLYCCAVACCDCALHYWTKLLCTNCSVANCALRFSRATEQLPINELLMCDVLLHVELLRLRDWLPLEAWEKRLSEWLLLAIRAKLLLLLLPLLPLVILFLFLCFDKWILCPCCFYCFYF